MGEPRSRGRRKPSQGAVMRALRGARDLYVRGLRGLDRLLAAASPRRAGVGVGRPTSSRVFGGGGGGGDRDTEEELRELVRAMQAARRGAAGSGKAEAGVPAAVKMRGATRLERIDEEAAVVQQTSC
ncbi:unnamed protein product [Urochloa humidicola]